MTPEQRQYAIGGDRDRLRDPDHRDRVGGQRGDPMSQRRVVLVLVVIAIAAAIIGLMMQPQGAH